METEGSHPVIKKKKHHNIFDQVKTITKDRDNKSSKLLKDIGSQNLIRFDPCHFRKNFKAQLQNFISQNKEPVHNDKNGNEVRVNNPFYGLENHIIKWVNTCLREQSDDRRIAMLFSMVPHFLGQHDNCLHGDDYDDKDFC